MDWEVVIAILIIIGSIALFTVTFILNKKIKAPDDTPLPDQCVNCNNSLCKSKVEDKITDALKNKNELTPDELIDLIKCEEENTNEE